MFPDDATLSPSTREEHFRENSISFYGRVLWLLQMLGNKGYYHTDFFMRTIIVDHSLPKLFIQLGGEFS